MHSMLQEMAQRLADHANSDSSFASLLLSNPEAAAEREFGKRLPGFANLHATKNAAGKIEVSINGSQEDLEMSEEELEAVVGGVSFPFPIPLD